jgi:uncharacterized glyoxalase superfamily protein PhnB
MICTSPGNGRSCGAKLSILAAGGKIVVAIKGEDYGGRGFACLDLESHMWSVGSYDPWAATN